jgi:hypothetical protein
LNRYPTKQKSGFIPEAALLFCGISVQASPEFTAP